MRCRHLHQHWTLWRMSLQHNFNIEAPSEPTWHSSNPRFQASTLDIFLTKSRPSTETPGLSRSSVQITLWSTWSSQMPPSFSSRNLRLHLHFNKCRSCHSCGGRESDWANPNLDQICHLLQRSYLSPRIRALIAKKNKSLKPYQLA